jgi:NAD+ diphosphatase
MDVSEFDTTTLTAYQSQSAMFFVNDHILTNATTQSPFLPLNETIALTEARITSAHLCNGVIIVQCNIAGIENLSSCGIAALPIRTFLLGTTHELQHLALKATHWLNWDKQSRFCGRCGALLINVLDNPEKKCLDCGHSHFPRFSPAVMVLIQNKDKILLARSQHFRPGVYSALAGFIEMGETAEMTAHREVKEEVGLTISSLQYYSSQTWPFPDSFMIAFTAQYQSGEIVIDHSEIEDAQWFSKNKLPLLPSKPSISRLLIDSVLND